jgi:hypothetical protein
VPSSNGIDLPTARDDLAAMLFTSHSNTHLKHILRQVNHNWHGRRFACRPYTNYTLYQSLEVHFTSTSSYLELSQPLFEPLHIPCEYILPITTVTKMGLGETIVGIFCHTSIESRRKSPGTSATSYKSAAEPRPSGHSKRAQ